MRKRNLLEQNKPQCQQTKLVQTDSLLHHMCELCYVLLVWKPGKPLCGWKPQNQSECGRGCGLKGLRKGEGVKKSQLWRLVWVFREMESINALPQPPYKLPGKVLVFAIKIFLAGNWLRSTSGVQSDVASAITASPSSKLLQEFALTAETAELDMKKFDVIMSKIPVEGISTDVWVTWLHLPNCKYLLVFSSQSINF